MGTLCLLAFAAGGCVRAGFELRPAPDRAVDVADAGADSGSDAGADSGSDAGADSGTDAVTDSGTDAVTDNGTDNGVDTVAQPRWSWLNPLPQGVDLNAVWGTGPTDLVAVGAFGAMARFDGVDWSVSRLPGGVDLHGVWAHGDVTVAVGAGGQVWRHDAGAGAWSAQSLGTSDLLTGVWGSGPTDVFVVSYGGEIFHRDASGWTEQEKAAMPLRAVWGLGPTFVVAAGLGATLVRYDGSNWSVVGVSGAGATHFHGVWASSPSDIFVVGIGTDAHHYDGTAWAQQPLGASHNLQAVWGSGSHDVVAVGRDGVLLHHDGTAWLDAGVPTGLDLNGVWGAGETAIAVGLAGTVLVGQESAWADAGSRLIGSDGWTITGLWGDGASSVYAVAADRLAEHIAVPSAGQILRWDGTRWALSAVPVTIGALFDIWGSGPSDIFAVGWGPEAGSGAGPTIVHHDGSGWQRIDNGAAVTPHDLAGVWGSGPSDVLMVGDAGTVLRYDGSGFETMPTTTTQFFRAAWGSGPTDVYAVTADAVDPDGEIHRYDGTAWAHIGTHTGVRFFGVWGSGPNDVWVVGRNSLLGHPTADSGVLLRFDGVAGWASEGRPLALHRVWGRGPTDVYLVGWRGYFAVGGYALLHHDGSALAELPLPFAAPGLHDIWGTADELHVVGVQQAALRHGP